MLYKLKTPNNLYNGVSEGVPFLNGIGQTDDKNTRNVLVNDYGYEDITDYSVFKESAKLMGQSTKEASKNIAESVKELLQKGEQETDETEVDKNTTNNLEDLTVPELKEKAKELNLTKYSELTKPQLIELISKELENDNA